MLSLLMLFCVGLCALCGIGNFRMGRYKAACCNWANAGFCLAVLLFDLLPRIFPGIF